MRYNKINCLILLASLLLIRLEAFAQSGKVPPFRVVQANGKIFKAEDLPMGKPIIIIYFLPDCDHCQKLIKELTKRMAEFNKASISMITYEPLDKVVKFINDYHLQKFSNIYIGTEGNSLFVRNYYKIGQMPFVALYNKNGDVIKLYPKEESLNKLSTDLKNLK